MSYPQMRLSGISKQILEIKWIDFDGQISWTGAPDEKFEVDDYMVEFASSSNTWVYKYLPDCITVETIPISFVTTCSFPLEILKESPVFLENDDLVRVRV